MKHVYIVAVIFAVASPVAAFNLQNAQVASDLGQLIAAEEFCDLSYNHDAIDAYIDSRVDHADMGFPQMLAGQVAVAEYTIEGMSDTNRRAHCRAVAATARVHNFID